MPKSWTINAWRPHLHACKPRRYLPRATCEFDVGTRTWVFRLRSEWWVGMYLVAWRRKGPTVGPLDSAWSYIRRPEVKKKAAAAAGGDGARHVAAMESAILAQLMPLVEHCALVRYDDGDQRTPGWITIKTLGAAWVVQVKDPCSANSFQFVSESVDKALEGAALLLACDDAPWQPDPFLRKAKGK